MENRELVLAFLQRQGLWPAEGLQPARRGLRLWTIPRGDLMLEGSAEDLIRLADLLVALALSGENEGQHWHLDMPPMVAEDSEIPGVIMMRRG